MISTLPQESLDICFDALAGSLRPQWEAGPSNLQFKPCKENKNICSVATTAIHGHIYYLEQLNEILDMGENISNRYYLLNTNCNLKAEIIQSIIDERVKKKQK